MDRTTTIAIMAAILAAPRKGDYHEDVMAAEAVRLYEAVTLITRPLEGARVLGIPALEELDPGEPDPRD